MANYVNVAAVCTLTILDNAAAAADPTTLTAYVRSPASSGELTYVQGTSGTWTHPGTGSYTFSFTPDAIGQWRVGFTAEHANWSVANAVAIEVSTLRPFD